MAKRKGAQSLAVQQSIPEFLQGTEPVQKLDAELVDMERMSKRLEAATVSIKREVGNVAKSFCKIGFKLWEVKEGKLYIGQGFKSLADYGEKVLGFKKSSIANYIAICERFSVHKDGNPTATLTPDFASFSYGQLSLMLSLPDDKLGEVSPDATCKEIRDLKKDGGEIEGQEILDMEPSRRASPPIELFNRTLTEENIAVAIKLLRDNIGRELSIYVEEIE